MSSSDSCEEVKMDFDQLDQIEKEHLCNDFKKKIKDANLDMDKARSKLLGHQWFQGRTGFVSANVNSFAKSPSE